MAGEGPAVTLLHGFMQTGRSWDEQGRRLRGRRVVVPDLPGHGASAAAEASLPAAAAALLELWDHLGIERSHLAGYSMGGRVALFTAAAHPHRVAGLLTIGAHAGFEGEARAARQAQDEALAARVEREGIGWFAAHWAALPMFAGLAQRGPARLAELDAMRRSQDAAAIARALRGLGGAAAEPFWDRLGAISCPSLFVAGARDGPYVAAARRLAASVPRGRLALIQGAGHSAHLEEPEAFAGLLADHLCTR